MTNQTNTPEPAAQEIDPTTLDHVVGGASVIVHDARKAGGTQQEFLKQEQADKLA